MHRPSEPRRFDSILHLQLVRAWSIPLVVTLLVLTQSGCKNCCVARKDISTPPVGNSTTSPSVSATGSAPKPSTATATPTVASGSASAPQTFPQGKINLFDGTTLKGWKITDFAGPGEIKVQPAFKGDQPAIVLEQGIMTGITWTNPMPRINYEVTLEAMRVGGSDFFCGLTFPVGEKHLSFIVGGWGGSVVGLSSVDGEDAAHNETTKYMNFETGRWYRIRVKVRSDSVQAWIDDQQVVNLVTTDRGLSIRLEVEASTPLGIATWSTSGAVRKLQLETLKPD